MASIPLHQIPMANNMPQEANRGGSISLAQLMDFIIQKTYDELIVLADTIGSQTDMDKKKSLYNYTTKTRQLFIRLLALVKWVNNISKVNKSTSAIALLDQQSQLFMDTADQLARLSRETLVHARVPFFHIPAAVEILTTGTFNRLPSCVKDKIVPYDPITPTEEKKTLQKLSQVILHRLVIGNLLPQMRDVQIEAGRVTIRVPNEFSMCLTVMGDGLDIPWRLLDIEFLVSDRETGNGTALVHPLQIKYMHQLVQSRLLETSSSLSDAYYILHNFCQSLQLEVLYSQTLRLIQDRLNNDIHVDQYKPGERLTVSYWKELTMKELKSKRGYKLMIHIDQNDPAEPLAIIDMPSLVNKESEVAHRMINIDQLSMEYLLVHTINIRTKFRLSKLKQELQNTIKDVECTLAKFPAVLSVTVLKPCLESELLLITIDTYTGMLQCHVPEYDVPLVSELSAALNGDRSRLAVLISELRFWITQRRCEKTLQPLPVTTHDKFPIIFGPNHPMTENGKRRMFVRFYKHSSVVLIVEFKEKDSSPCEIEYIFYLAIIKPCLMDEALHGDNQNQSIDNDIPKIYYRLRNLVEFDTFVVTHGPFTSIETDLSGKGTKRPSFGPSDCTDVVCTSQSKRLKHSAYFIPELAHVVALCDKRIPFVMLANELSERNIAHQGLQVDANATALVIKIIQLPSPSLNPNITAGWQSLLKRLLGVSIRMLTRDNSNNTKNFMVEFEFYSSPLKTSNPNEQGSRRPVYFPLRMEMNETVSNAIDSLLDEWAKIVYLYSIVQGFTEYLNIEKYNFRNMVDIKSYTYDKLIIGYGPDHKYTVIIHWSSSDKSFKLDFVKSLTTPSINGHSLIKNQLEAHLNHHNNLAQIIQILHETLQPCISINKLPTIPHLGVFCGRTIIPVQTFTIIPQSITTIKITYQEAYCLEVKFRGDGFVSVRDGAYSRFDRSNVINEYTPTQGLKTFLSKYECEATVFRHQSQSEDDNPPSPVSMETDRTSAGFMGHHRNDSLSPAKRDGLRFHHAPSTPPSISNLHTPASPHTMNMQVTQHQNFANSPAASFNLTSPPSLAPNTSNMMPHPSPGSGFVANSPMNSIHIQSPAGHIDSSPFPSQSMTSPVGSNWPGSPSVPRPSPARPGQSPGYVAVPSPTSDYKTGGIHVSRVLPQRSWAGAVPTLLTHQAFNLLCTPSIHPSGLPGTHLAPLERFLGCVYMKRQVQRFIQTDEKFIAFNGTEPGAVYFKVETLQCRIALNPQHLQSLHIKIQPIPDHKDKWIDEEIQILETFFDTKASSVPYKSNTLLGFCKILTVPLKVIKDFVQIMKLELNSNVQQYQLKWSVQWCLKVPPSATPAAFPLGMPAILFRNNKVLFFLQITRIGNYQREPPSLVLPLIYDISTNTTQLFEKRDPEPKTILSAVSIHLKRIVEFTKLQECSLFPAVRDILLNFMLPSEQPVTQQAVVTTNGQIAPTQQVDSPAMQELSPRNGGPSQPPEPYNRTQSMPACGTIGRPPQ